MTGRIARAFALLGLLLVMLLARSALAAGPNDGLAQAPQLDRSTPKRSLEGFIHAGDKGQFDVAEQYLDLRAIPKARQSKDGPDFAQKLWYVITHTAHFDTSKAPDDPTLVPAKTETSIGVGTLYLGEEPIPLAMSRERFDDGVDRWVIARGTIAMAPELYSSLGVFTWQDRIPDSLRGMIGGNALWQWIGLALAMPLAYLVALVVTWLVGLVLRFFARRTRGQADDYFVEAAHPPVRLMLAVLLVNGALGFLRLTETVDVVVDHLMLTLFIVACAWLAFVAVATVVRWMNERLPEGPGEVAHRSQRTRLAMFERIAAVLLVMIASALVLMQFAVVRNVGVSLLASAGVAGVVLGFAAQKSLGAIVAGLQLSLTQPIRIGDEVVIETEFGTVEQIFLTYVVVRLWDERRMVVPVTRFLEQPFQNWSKVTSELTGAVTLTCDFRTPIERARQELQRICASSAVWDRRTCILQVTEANERSITLRALVSAASPGAAWDLRCEVREKLIAFLCALDGGRHLPRGREEWLQKDAGAN